MLLHELYFSGLGGDGQGMVPAMALALEASFGGVALARGVHGDGQGTGRRLGLGS